jgi:hypothetical protein
MADTCARGYTEACARAASCFRVTRRLAAGETFAVEFLLTQAADSAGTRPAAPLHGATRGPEQTLRISFGRTDDAAPPAERFRPLEEYPAVLWLYPAEDFAQTEVVHRYFKNYTVEPLRAAATLADSFDKANLLDAVSWVRRRLDESV